MTASDNAVEALLQIMARRRHVRPSFVLPLLLLALGLAVPQWRVALLYVGGMLLVATLLRPVFESLTWGGEALDLLRRRRCLDEVAATCMTPEEVVDGAARFTVRSALGWWFAAYGVVAATLLFLGRPFGPLLVAGLLLPLLVVAAAYVQLALVAAWRGEEGASQASLLTTMLCAGGVTGLGRASDSPTQAMLEASVLTAVAMMARGQAVARFGPARPKPKLVRKRRTAAVANPIAWRERVRSRDSVLALVLLGVVLAAPAAAVEATGARGVPFDLVVPVTVLGWVGIYAGWGFCMTCPALVREHEEGTLPLLVGTGMSAREVVDGWTLAALKATLPTSVPMIAVLSATGSLAAVVLAAVGLFLGVRAGLLVSLRSSRQAAANAFAGGPGGLLVPLAALAFWPWATSWVAMLGAAAVLAVATFAVDRTVVASLRGRLGFA